MRVVQILKPGLSVHYLIKMSAKAPRITSRATFGDCDNTAIGGRCLGQLASVIGRQERASSSRVA